MTYRIAFYNPYPYSRGGSQAVLLSLASGLDPGRYSPTLVVPDDGLFVQDARKLELPTLVLPPGKKLDVFGGSFLRPTANQVLSVAPYLLEYWKRVFGWLKREGIHLLHCNDYRGVLMAGPAGRLARIPVVWHMHGLVPQMWLNLAATIISNCVVTVSVGVAEYLRRQPWFRLSQGKLLTIHNGLAIEEARRLANRSLEDPRFNTSRPLVTFVGTLHPRKGIEYLIEAIPLVLSSVPDAKFLLIGGVWHDGQYATELRSLTQSLRVETHVHFLGHRADAIGFVAASDVLVLPSVIEPFGMVLLEAMALGKPVVATRTAGPADIVVNGQTGFLVEPGNVEQLASAIVRALESPDIARRLGEAGRQRVEADFTHEQMCGQFEELYSKLIDRSCNLKVGLAA